MRSLIETERLCLGLPEPADAAAIATYYEKNRAHLQPWMPSWPSGFFTEEFWREQARAARQDFRAGTAVRMIIALLAEPRQVIGNLSLTQVLRGPAYHCVMGYSLAEDAQGKGYMLEAVEGAVGYAFDELRLHRVSASYMPHNRRSAAVLRRAGFTVEGYTRDYLRIDGEWEDHIMTAIINPGWSG
jgi:ribosomal-protein-alanine N-acetyltransferase